MDEKSLALDFEVKGANLCRFLIDEKNEKLFSKKLFDTICLFTEYCVSLNSNALSKNEIALIRKNASIESEKITLHLNALYISGFISEAQKDSMIKTLDVLKKEINI